MGSADAVPLPPPAAAEGPSAEIHPHNFEAQKQEHQKIRNDPDYDDWEYGTEPLPQEAWLKAKADQGTEQPG